LDAPIHEGSNLDACQYSQHHSTFIPGGKKIGVTCTIRMATVDIYIAKWTACEISLCGYETVSVVLKL